MPFVNSFEDALSTLSDYHEDTIKELQKEIDELKETIQTLENEKDELQTLLETLQ